MKQKKLTSLDYNRPPSVDAQTVNLGIFKLAGLIYTKENNVLLSNSSMKKSVLSAKSII